MSCIYCLLSGCELSDDGQSVASKGGGCSSSPVPHQAPERSRDVYSATRQAHHKGQTVVVVVGGVSCMNRGSLVWNGLVRSTTAQL